jgi:uncharacterized membrane protein YqjE
MHSSSSGVDAIRLPGATAAKPGAVDPGAGRVLAGQARRCSVIEEANKKPAAERSVGELVTDLTDEVKRLVRDEMRLAVFELQRKGKKMGLGAGLFGAAGLFAFLGAGTLVAAAVLALALVVPGWLAAVLVAVALFLVAGIAALVGKKEVTQGVPPVPEEAITGVREDVDTVKQGVRT